MLSTETLPPAHVQLIAIKLSCGIEVNEEYNTLLAYPTNDDEEYHNNEIALKEKVSNIVTLPLYTQAPCLRLSQRVFQKTKYWIKRLLGITTPSPSSRIYERWIPSLSPLNDNWQQHLNSIFNNYSIDIVQVEMPPMIGAVLSIPSSIKKVYVHHELAFVRHDLELQQIDNSQIAKAYAYLAKILEINLLNMYDAVITLSTTDKNKLINSGVSVPIYSSFAVVESVGYQSPYTINKVLSFVGPDHHRPNYEGILWFLTNCWGNLKAIDDSFQLQIIGHWSKQSIDYISSNFKDVKFLGYVDDLGIVLRGTIMIVPITIGSGIRMKVLEAASLGIPIVSTSVGVEGLPISDGTECFIRDYPDDFINGILSLLNQPLAESMCKAANDMVKKNYSFESLKQDRLSTIEEVSNY